GMRFGVHEMYTSDALVSGNVIRDTNVGVIVMTEPEGNVVLNNDVRQSNSGTMVAGSSSYIAGNLFAENDIGMYVSAKDSVYEGNVVINNDRGMRSSLLLPTTRVTDNDIVGNRRSVTSALGPLQVWSGNYWENAIGRDRNRDGVLDRAYIPTSTLGSKLDRVPGASTLALSPAVDVVREFRDTVPGLRSTGVMDNSPRVRPVHPEIIEEYRQNSTDTERKQR
ncbi:MAG: NosD domain-containing protein, partial [Halobacteria archaeon]|nr:NosD domain-containing protein [Halobacteria archaeon]